MRHSQGPLGKSAVRIDGSATWSRLLHRTPRMLMKQRWELIKEQMKQEAPSDCDLADSFEKTNMSENWKRWCYDGSGQPTISLDSQTIESWHAAFKQNKVVECNRVLPAKASIVRKFKF